MTMALPKTTKRIITDIGAAVQKAAGHDPATLPELEKIAAGNELTQVNKAGRPSPRTGRITRQTLLLTENVAERLTMALATEQVKRRKRGEKIDKSSLIEEMIVKWLKENNY
jgi:hypothetical protein